MSKELLFQMAAEIGDLDEDVAEARKLLVKANEDPKNPMCGKFKFGESGSGYGSNTIINKWINGSFNLIQLMNDAHLNTFTSKYDLMLKIMKAIDEVNREDDATARKANKKVKLTNISATKYAAVIADMLPSVLALKQNEGKNRTVTNIREIYHTLIHDVLLAETIRQSGNEEIEYTFENTGVKRSVKDRWNGNQTVKTAIVDTKAALLAARQNFLKAKVVNA